MSGVGGRRGRREWVLDALLWAALSLPIAYNQATHSAFGWLLVVLIVMAAAVGLSRRLPLVALVIVVLGSLLDGNFSFAIPVMSYLVGLRTDRARPVVLVFVVIMVGGTLFNLGVLRTTPSQWFLLASILLLAGVFPWLVGRYRAQQRELVSAGWERAVRLERERQMVAGQVRLRERARIAQDMHDSLGHELSLIALRAGALEMATCLPEPHRAAAGRIRESAAAATDRLRDIIGVLRDAEEPASLEPALRSTDELLARARDSGVAATLRRSGSADSVPAMVDRAVHRIVREALTNATRHAPGAAVTVTLTHTSDATTVAVSNEAPPVGPSSGVRPAGRGGVGLVGLREQVRIAGGTFTADPYDGGFRVSAWLPHDAQPAAAEEPPAATELRRARRRVRRSLVVALVAPAALAVVMASSYYPFAVFNSTLSAEDFDRMRIGTPRTELAGLLPTRQVRERPTSGVPLAPPGSVCEFYTDGNFPLAQATYRLCFADGRLIAKDDLR